MSCRAPRFGLFKHGSSAAVLALAAALHAAPACAQGAAKISDGVVRMGLLLDMNSLYEEVAGKGTVQAVQMAIEDFGGKVHGAPVEVLVVDHQNKADLAGAKAREWFDTQKVDMIGDVAASATALAAAEVARQKNKIIATVPAEQAFMPLARSNCALVKK